MEPSQPRSLERHDPRRTRSHLIREALLFQVKLFIDGLKDIVLAPISMVATLLDLAAGRFGSRSYFLRVLRLGQAFDAWLGLYDSEMSALPPPSEASPGGKHLDQLEALIKDDAKRGGLTTHATRTVDWMARTASSASDSRRDEANKNDQEESPTE